MDDPTSYTHFVKRLKAQGLCAPDAEEALPAKTHSVDATLFEDRARLREALADYAHSPDRLEALLDAMDTLQVPESTRQDVRRCLIARLARRRKEDAHHTLDAMRELVRSRLA
tara:strand:- start:866 stop:1204 length:339 start_codon:yes stop_codon:yes gene_type:complete